MLTAIATPLRKLFHGMTYTAGLNGTLAKWSERRKTRSALRRLDDHMLHDIGLLREDSRNECDKRFWQD